MLFYDTNTDKIVIQEELKNEYLILKQNQETDEESFDDFIDNCLTRNNGTLEYITSDTINFIACTTYGTDNSPIDTETAAYNIECWLEEGIPVPKQLDKWIYTALYNYFIK